MRALENERVRRIAAASQSSAKRKLTDLEAAAQAAKATPVSMLDKVKKLRTSSPPQRTTSEPKPTATRRAVSHGTGPSYRASGAKATLSASMLQRHDQQEHQRYLQQDLHAAVIQEKDHVAAARTSDAHERYLEYATAQQEQAPRTPPPSNRRASTANAHTLFSRYADPSVQKTPESTNSSPFKFPGYRSSDEDSPVHTPVRTSGVMTTPTGQQPPRGEDGLIDLQQVDTVSNLETVEGEDILSVMMAFSTPRVGRHFPSEESRTASEEREVQFLRRRRLAAARRSIDMKMPVVTHQILKTSWEFDNVLEPVSSPSMRGRVRRREVVSEEARQARDDAEDAKAAAAAAATENDPLIDEEDEDDDDETTETKVARFARVSRWNVRRFLLWALVGAGILCLLDVAIPLVLSLLEPPPPYCDNNASALNDAGSKAVSIIDKSEYTALQPYREDCRACPLFGVCAKGILVTCLPPLEGRNGACVESQEVQEALEHVAKSIEQFVVEKARAQVCGASPLLPPPRGFRWNLDDVATDRVFILLSELRDVVLNSPFAETLMNISTVAESSHAAAGYVFNRSLDLAMSSFQKIAQGGFIKMTSVFGGSSSDASSDMLIQFSASVAPFACRAKNQLTSDAPIIAVIVIAIASSGLGYWRWRKHKATRAIVDRLVKEARYFLLGRSHRSEPFYPANHLCDNLLDTLEVSPVDRKGLREKVWPIVANIICEDSRVRSYIAPIHGKQMVVWEWISSTSPIKKVENKPRLRPRKPRSRYSL